MKIGIIGAGKVGVTLGKYFSINNLSGSKICSGSTLVVPYYTGTPQ